MNARIKISETAARKWELEFMQLIYSTKEIHGGWGGRRERFPRLSWVLPEGKKQGSSCSQPNLRPNQKRKETRDPKIAHKNKP
jgi:hypothetical protein